MLLLNRLEKVRISAIGRKSAHISEYKKMKIQLFSILSVLAASLLVGCGAPRVKQVNAVAGGQYKYGQPPSQRIVGDSGRLYKVHVKASQALRLAHERAMAEMDYRAEEARYAKEKGVALPQQAQPSQQSPRAAFMPPPGYFQPPPPQFIAVPAAPQIVLSAPSYQNYPSTWASYPSYGAHYEQRQLFGVRFRALVAPAYGGGRPGW